MRLEEESLSLHFYRQGIFKLPRHIGMVWEELAIDDTKLYTAEKLIAAQLNVIAVTGIAFMSQARSQMHR